MAGCEWWGKTRKTIQTDIIYLQMGVYVAARDVQLLFHSEIVNKFHAIFNYFMKL